MIDVSLVVQGISAVGVSVAAVGGAVTGVKALTSSFKHYREAMGMSVGAAMRQARKDQYEAQHGGVTASGRQMEKEYEQMWAEQEAEGVDFWDGYTAEDDARDRAAAGLPPR